MKRNIFMLVAALFAVCFVFTSCKDDNEPATVEKVEYGLSLNVPLDVEGGSLQNAMCSIKQPIRSLTSKRKTANTMQFYRFLQALTMLK